VLGGQHQSSELDEEGDAVYETEITASVDISGYDSEKEQ
jgi:hypothetical protein